MLVTFLEQVRQVEIITVKVDQVGVSLAKGEKILKQGSFVFRILCKPLFDMPVSGLLKGCTNQVKGGTFSRKTCGFNI